MEKPVLSLAETAHRTRIDKTESRSTGVRSLTGKQGNELQTTVHKREKEYIDDKEVQHNTNIQITFILALSYLLFVNDDLMLLCGHT